MQQAIVDLLFELISCPSITPNDAGCQDILQKRLRSLDFNCESFNHEGVHNTWARFGNRAPLLVFAGHTDVVPPGNESLWLTPPFIPTIKEHILYGRGACDMKGALACMVLAVESFLQNYADFPGSIAFLITSDEEGTADFGTQYVLGKLSERNESIDYCLIGEASSEHFVGDQIRVGRRGSLHGKITVHGKQGHVAYPDHVINPIHSFSAALHELSHEVWDHGNASFPPTTFQFTQIHSGTGALNVVPGTLQANFNFRFGTQSQVDDLQFRTESILKKHEVDYHLNWTLGGEPFLSKRATFIDCALHAISKITGKIPHCSTGGGTSDGRFIVHTGAELLELGVCHHSAHQINEHVAVNELNVLYACYYQILVDMFISKR